MTLCRAKVGLSSLNGEEKLKIYLLQIMQKTLNEREREEEKKKLSGEMQSISR